MTSNPTDPDVIYLEPSPGSPEGRMWCEDPVWDEIPECKGQSVEYRRVINPEPRWHVLIDADDEIVAGGAREEVEEIMVDLVEDWEAGRRDPENTMIPADEEHGYTLHGVYIGPEVEVGGG